LWHEFHRILAAFRPRWVCIENVPGLLSSNKGRDMGTIIGAMGKLGYGYAYRVLDAQWFDVPQRRRRVFIVGCLGNVRRAARVLFESESLPWDSPPSRETRSQVADCLTRGTESGGKGGYAGRCRDDDANIVAATLNSGGNSGGFRTEPGGHLIAHSQTARCLATRSNGSRYDGESEEFVVQDWPMTFDERNITSDINRSRVEPGLPCHTLHSDTPRVAFTLGATNRGVGQGHNTTHVTNRSSVRRLTPRECERLQSFPDDWTALDASGKPVSNSARYRMLGNAVACNVAAWIANRIRLAEESAA
jgi:DNA (cytosine-5)-methyltransferase 1